MSTEEKKLPQPPAGEAKQESKNRIRAMFLNGHCDAHVLAEPNDSGAVAAHDCG